MHGKIRDGLYSASFGPRASELRPLAADRSRRRRRDRRRPLALRHGARPGDRRLPGDHLHFNHSVFSTAVQLRPGDVMADVRVARLKDDRWSRIGAINRNPEASMRPPGPDQRPAGRPPATTAGAAVAWQEPDQTGTARIWLRRIFGTTPGPVLEASPTSWEGQPVTADADAFSLAVSAFAQVRVAFRIAPARARPSPAASCSTRCSRTYSVTAGKLTGAQLADGGAGAVGPVRPASPPATKAAAKARCGSASSPARSCARSASTTSGALAGVTVPAGPAGPGGRPGGDHRQPGRGRGLAAYAATRPDGRPAVAIRQEFTTGAAQTGLVFGRPGRPDLRTGDRSLRRWRRPDRLPAG